MRLTAKNLFFKLSFILYSACLIYASCIYKLRLGMIITNEWMLVPNLIPFRTIPEYIGYLYSREINLDIILNNLFTYHLVFLPLGIMLPLAFKKGKNWPIVLFFSLGLSTLIEILQITLRTGICDIDDVILNTAYVMVGFGIYCLALKLLCNLKQKDTAIKA